MAYTFRLSAMVSAVFLVCSAAGAQQVRNGQTSVRQETLHTRTAARTSGNSAGNSGRSFQSSQSGQPGQQAGVHHISPTGRVSPAIANDFGENNLPGVPGLGFDFPHLAAVGGHRNHSFSDSGRHGHNGQETFIPILFGGYPYYYDDLSADQADQTDQPPVQASQAQPQVIAIQQPVPETQPSDSVSDAENNSFPSGDAQPVEPVRDIGDFILVRRDGRLVFASLFSVVGTQVRYITPEGFRRTLPVSEIDADATEQMNEARGTTVLIHN